MSVDPYDDEDIKDEDIIIRRVDPDYHLAHNHATGKKRVSTKLFSPSSGKNGGMSVDLLGLMLEAGEDPTAYVTTPKYQGSVQLSASELRKVELRIGKDPLPENPYHGEVWPPSTRSRFTKGQQRSLLNSATWFVELPDVELG